MLSAFFTTHNLPGYVGCILCLVQPYIHPPPHPNRAGTVSVLVTQKTTGALPFAFLCMVMGTPMVIVLPQPNVVTIVVAFTILSIVAVLCIRPYIA